MDEANSKIKTSGKEFFAGQRFFRAQSRKSSSLVGARGKITEGECCGRCVGQKKDLGEGFGYILHYLKGGKGAWGEQGWKEDKKKEKQFDRLV